MLRINRSHFLLILFIFIQSSIKPTYSQIPQQQVQLPEVLRRLSLPYHICTKTVDNLWECISSTSIEKNPNINSVETVTQASTVTESDQNVLETTDQPDLDSITWEPSSTGKPGFVPTPTSTTRTAKQQMLPSTTPSTVPSTTCKTAGDETTVGNDLQVETEFQSSEMSSTIPNNMNSDEEGTPTASSNLIFEDEFQTFDLENWTHDVTMSGGGNWEFQMYVNNRSNSFVKDGMLHLRPTLTADTYGEEFLSNGFLSLHGESPADQCTSPWGGGCEKRGNVTNILNPIMSAKLRTNYSFAFKYGKVVVRAKLPSGDWLRAGISLLPFRYNYGRWPASGEIHIVESRGNKDLENSEGNSIGSNQISSSLDFGPFFPLNGKDKAEFRTLGTDMIGFDEEFHIYELEWTPDFIKFSVDGNETGKVEPSQQGFWDVGQFENIYSNPWQYSENIKMAPFDQKFYLAINLAVGGTTEFFPDDAAGPNVKPWSDLSSTAYKEFWDRRSDWLPTWQNSSFIIDYVRVFSL